MPKLPSDNRRIRMSTRTRAVRSFRESNHFSYSAVCLTSSIVWNVSHRIQVRVRAENSCQHTGLRSRDDTTEKTCETHQATSASRFGVCDYRHFAKKAADSSASASNTCWWRAVKNASCECSESITPITLPCQQIGTASSLSRAASSRT